MTNLTVTKLNQGQTDGLIVLGQTDGLIVLSLFVSQSVSQLVRQTERWLK